MKKPVACFLIALTTTSGAYAHDCVDTKEFTDSQKSIESSGINLRTQNLIGSLVKRGALFYDENKKAIELDLTKLTNLEMNMYIKSNETVVDMETSTITLEPVFSKFIIEKNILKLDQLSTPSRSLEDDEIMEGLLDNISPEIRDDITTFMNHSFA